MKGYTIQHSIELLEKKIKSLGSGGASTASEVSFDNTDTGLVATNVQGALSEIDLRSKYSTTKAKIGKWIDGRDVYRLVIVFENEIACPSQQWAQTSVPTSDLNVELLINTYCSNGPTYYPMAVDCTLEVNYLQLLNVRAVQLGVKTVVLEYVENVSSEAKSTRKKTSK